MSKRLLDEIGEKKECSGINSRIGDRIRADVSSHPLRYGKPARAGLDHDGPRRPLEHTDNAKALAYQGMEPVEDRNEAGTGIVS